MPGAAEALKLPAPSLGGPGEGDAVAAASSNLQSLALVPSSALPATAAGSSSAKPKNEGKGKPAPVLVPTQTKSIGIIHPPPDIRSIVDKTATFVARNGPEFEKKILATNRGNAKFNFLNPTDPYHAYYRFKINETASQLGLPVAAPIPAPAPPVPAAPSTTAGILTAPDDKVAGEASSKGPKQPEPELYTVRVPEGLSGMDLDVIKLTAQFVAKNGKAFLTGLIAREHMNPQFHFLKPTHSLFTFFTALADAYSRVLTPPKQVLQQLREHAEGGYATVLSTCLARLEWERSQERARKQAEDQVEQERVQMALIDWHDFVVVETIEFVDGEDVSLPPPISQEELIRKAKQLGAEEELEAEAEAAAAAAEAPAAGANARPMDDEERQLVEEGMKEAEKETEAGVRAGEVGAGGEAREPEGPAPAPPPEDGPAPPPQPPEGEPPPEEEEDEEMELEEDEAPMKIVKGWKRPEERAAPAVDSSRVVVSPITGELIPVSEMAEHMRISLIDPKYKEQKERMMAKLRGTTLAGDDEITRNIVVLARTRPDIFGTTEEEVSSAVRQEMERKKEEPSRVMWDGHTASIGRTTTQALQQGTVDTPEPPRDTLPIAGPSAPPPPPPKPAAPRPLPPPPQPVLRPGFPPQFPGLNPLGPPGMRMATMSVPIFNPATGRAIGSANVPVFAGGMQARPPQMPPPPQAPIGAMLGAMRPPGATPPPPPGTAAHPFAPPAPPMGLAPGPPAPLVPGPPMPPLGALGAMAAMGAASSMGAGVPLGAMSAPGVPPEEERDSKRARLEEPSLVPELAFLAQHPGPVRISVAVPAVEGEAALQGQMVQVTVSSLAETTGALKDIIAAEVGLPANKQKLSGKAGFFKDTLSLAYYNVGPGDTVTLSLKERGGRKK